MQQVPSTDVRSSVSIPVGPRTASGRPNGPPFMNPTHYIRLNFHPHPSALACDSPKQLLMNCHASTSYCYQIQHPLSLPLEQQRGFVHAGCFTVMVAIACRRIAEIAISILRRNRRPRSTQVAIQQYCLTFLVSAVSLVCSIYRTFLPRSICAC